MLFHSNAVSSLNSMVYRFGNPVRSDTASLIVFVHPYTTNRTYEDDEQYVKLRDDTIAYSTNPVLLLVSQQDFESVVHRYRHRDFRGDRYIVKTEEANPKPIKGSWAELREWISRIHPSEIIICGAELHLNAAGQMYTGCVLDASNKLSGLARLQIDRQRCWIEKN